MPVYEYLCVPCGNRFEKLQKADATEPISCPACSSSEVKKVISACASPTTTTAAPCTPRG